MKVMGQRNLVGEGAGKAPAEELIRYVPTLPVAACDIAHTSIEILEQKVAAWARFLDGHQDVGEA